MKHTFTSYRILSHTSLKFFILWGENKYLLQCGELSFVFKERFHCMLSWAILNHFQNAFLLLYQELLIDLLTCCIIIYVEIYTRCFYDQHRILNPVNSISKAEDSINQGQMSAAFLVQKIRRWKH